MSAHAVHCHHVHQPSHGFTAQVSDASAHSKNKAMKKVSGCGQRQTLRCQAVRPASANAPVWINARFGKLRLSYKSRQKTNGARNSNKTSPTNSQRPVTSEATGTDGDVSRLDTARRLAGHPPQVQPSHKVAADVSRSASLWLAVRAGISACA
jgi:hypothetical protein